MSEILKRAIIKEELLSITGDFQKAVILQQLIYWSQRTSDFDKFILEERERAKELGNEVHIELNSGWIFKSAQQLSEETMLGLHKSNILKHINALIEMGYIERRKNPKLGFDHKFQYRVKICEIQMSLLIKGYALEDYRIPLDFIVQAAMHIQYDKSQQRSCETQRRSSKTEQASCDLEHPSCETQHGCSDTQQQYYRLLTENTSEIVSDNTSENKNKNNPLILLEKEIHECLKAKFSSSSYDMWFTELHVKSMQNGEVVLSAQTDFIVTYLQSNHLPALREILDKLLGKSMQFRLVICDT